MFVLVRDGLLELSADLAEQDLPRVMSGLTVTLRAATFSDVVSLAAEPITLDHSRARMPARLVLIDAMALAWQEHYSVLVV